MEPDVVSTRKPNSRIVAQRWAHEAETITTYLTPMAVTSAIKVAGVLIEAARGGQLAKVRRDIVQTTRDVATSAGWRAAVNSLVRESGLLVAAAELSYVASLRGWTHVHVHSCADSAQVALFAHRLTGLRYSLTLHGPLGDYGSNQPKKWEQADFSFVITHRLLEEVTEVLGRDVGVRTEVVPMGVDTDKFSRKGAYIPWDGSGPARLFSCGRLNKSKGHDDLVRAVALMTAQGLDVELVIAGEDEQGGSGYRKELEGLILELDITDRVTLLGAVAEEQVLDYLQRAHVFALASHAEPLGVAIMEAMAMELPVVVTSGGGVVELVENRCTGMLVEPGDPKGLAREILTILSQPDLALSLGHRAKQRVTNSFTSRRGATALTRRLTGRTAPGPAYVDGVTR
ncbi:glycosyltransferase family 4 protein [Pseudarthrobacter sp. LMD1-1-1.1]